MISGDFSRGQKLCFGLWQDRMQKVMEIIIASLFMNYNFC